MNADTLNKKTHLLHFLQFLKTQPKGFVYHEQTIKKALQTKNTTQQSENQAPSHNSNQEQLDALKKKYHDCQACPLATQGRSQVVFGEGNPHAQLMFVGEGPGRDEDQQGRPFVGRAGQLLDKIIQAMGMQREDVYISNVVKCRPPGNRVPLPMESDTCTSILLFREIEIIKPKIICALGATALQALLGSDARITKLRGIFNDFHGIPVMPTYHPAYLLRNPEAKKVVWEDMKKILERLKE